MWQKFEEDVIVALEKALASMDVKLKAGNFISEPPGRMGDLAFSGCLALSKELNRPPRDIAKEIVEIINVSKPKYVERVEIAGPGYVNFFIDYAKFAPDILGKVLKEKKAYGRGKKKGKLIVEHTSANPDGPLHIGHGRNSITGDTISRILAFSGYSVSREFYVNDAGRQIALASWQYLKTPAKVEGKKDEWVLDLYLRANRFIEKNDISAELSEIMLAYEKNDPKVAPVFKLIVSSCVEGHVDTLKRLDISFDTFTWESTFIRDNSAQKLISLIEKSKYKVSEGKMLGLDLTSFGIEKEFLVRRSDGTMLYALRDLAYHMDKFKRAELLVDVLGSDHKLHFMQLRHALGVLGEKTENLNVIHYEFISLPEGQMSTRRNTFIALDELLDESVKRAKAEVDKRREDLPEKERQEIAEAVGLGAVRYYIASISPEKPINFTWDKALDFEQSSAPAIQYAYARACKILAKAKKADAKAGKLTDAEKDLVRALARLGKVVASSAADLKPHYVAWYANDVVTAFKKFYTDCKVIGSEEEAFRAALVLSTKQVLENCLGLLGIKPLENM